MRFDSTASKLTSFIFYLLYVTESCAAVKMQEKLENKIQTEKNLTSYRCTSICVTDTPDTVCELIGKRKRLMDLDS